MRAPAHTRLSVQQCLTKNGMNPVPHPPYLPDLAPTEFFLWVGWVGGWVVSWDEKSPQRETFCQCARAETKNGRSTKIHHN